MTEKIHISNRTRNLIIAVLLTYFLIHSAYSLVKGKVWINRPMPGFWVLTNMSVPSGQAQGLAGYQQGIKYADIILEVNGKPFNNADDLLKFVSRQKPGTPLTYLVERKGRKTLVTIPVQEITSRDYLLIFFAPKVSALFFLLIGIMVFYFKPNSRTSWAFLLFGVVCGLTIASVTDYRVNTFNPILVVLPLIGPALLLVSLEFPVPVKSRRYLYYYALFVIVPLIATFVYSFRNVSFFYLVTTPVMINNAMCGLLGIVLMVYSFVRSKDPLIRKRGKIVIYGFVLTFVGLAVTQIEEYSFGGSNIYAYYILIFSIVMLPASLGYAIVVHNLFDVDEFIRRTLVYIFVSGIVVILFVFLTASLSLLLQNVTGQSSQIAAVLSTISMVLLFRPLRNKIESVIDKRFNREKYEYQTTIREASEVLISIIEINELLNRILSTVINAIKITRGAIFIRGQEAEDKYSLFASMGYQNNEVLEPLLYEHPLIQHLERSQRGLQVNDIQELAAFRNDREPILELMRSLRVVLIIPILYQRKLIGMLALGEKMSGAWYSTEDIALLRTLMIQTAVSIENARKVAELKKMVELETSYRELKRLDELKDNFLSMVSHDLRTPMTSIKGYASILMEKIDKLERERQIKYLSIIVTESERLTRLINNLLDLQRFEAGKMVLQFEDVDICSLVKTCVESFEGAAMAKKMKLSANVSDEKYLVKGDYDRLAQVVSNLLSNAIKFTPEGGTITVSTESVRENDKSAVKVSVSDTGPGIPKEELSTLFDKFKQVESLVRGKEQGSGLGLSLVRDIIEHHSGKVGVESQPGAGSVFYFILESAGNK